MSANTVYIELSYGPVTVELRPDVAPAHVEHFKRLVDAGFYNGLKWHRVIEGFMAQTGCPLGLGVGGCGYNLRSEFNRESFEKGSVGMARNQDPNSASSQFFICTDSSQFLNGQYTYFGQVVDGIEHVLKIKKGDPNKNGMVTDPDRIIRAWLAEPLVPKS